MEYASHHKVATGHTHPPTDLVSWTRPLPLCVLVMQYIQRYRESGLVHETTTDQPLDQVTHQVPLY